MVEWHFDPDEEQEKLAEEAGKKKARWMTVAAAVVASFAGLCAAVWVMLNG